MLLCYPPPSTSNGDLPVALETAGGLIVVVIFPDALGIAGGVDGSIDGGGREVDWFCTVLFAGVIRETYCCSHKRKNTKALDC